MVDRDVEALRVEAEFLRDQVPGEGDRIGLEIVAEREVAEHLEERVMAGRVAHVVEVVVLAPGAHALLRGDGAVVVAVLLAGEDVLELHHAGIREHQRRVVARNERRGGHDLVAELLEVAEECAADLVDTGHERLTNWGNRVDRLPAGAAVAG